MSTKPSAIIAANDDDENDTMPLATSQSIITTTNTTFKNSKKRTPKKGKKTSYQMIGDGDIISSDDDLEYDGTSNHVDHHIVSPQHHTHSTNGHTAPRPTTHRSGDSNAGHSTRSTHKLSDSESASSSISDLEQHDFEDVQLTNDTKLRLPSTSPNGFHAINTYPDSYEMQNLRDKYGVSAYYGTRLQYNAVTQWHDIGWAIFWILHCIAIVLIFVLTWSSEQVHSVGMPHAHHGLFLMLSLLALSFVFAFLWTFLLKYCGGAIVWLLIIGNR